MVIVLRKDYTNANILARGGGLPIVRAFMEMAGVQHPNQQSFERTSLV